MVDPVGGMPTYLEVWPGKPCSLFVWVDETGGRLFVGLLTR